MSDLPQRPNAVPRNGSGVLLQWLCLPMAPSLNAYRRTMVIRSKKLGKARAMSYPSEEAKAFHARVEEIILQKRAAFHSEKPLFMDLAVCFARKSGDIDNRVKVVMDTLQNCGVYEDDKQIEELRVRRGPVVTDGRIFVYLKEIVPDFHKVLSDVLGGRNAA